MKKTLGGDRLGSGAKMTVDLHTYNRSTHDLSYVWRSTMASGTLVPFMTEIALPGDTFDINLDCNVLTHPTVGPLFGSYKVQLDIFEAPLRLYNALLHNNTLGIGMQMSTCKLPLMTLRAPVDPGPGWTQGDNSQINPSCILKYLGLSGIGLNRDPAADHTRDFNAVPLIAYWDIYKNYYANKQEEIGAVIHTSAALPVETVDNVSVINVTGPHAITQGGTSDAIPTDASTSINLGFTSTDPTPIPSQIIFKTSNGNRSMEELCSTIDSTSVPGLVNGTYDYTKWGILIINGWDYITPQQMNMLPPKIKTFELGNIDILREAILAETAQFTIDRTSLDPYGLVLGGVVATGGNPTFNNCMGTQEGLGIKTYQSDLFNNWLKTEWIDGPNGITAITAIDTSGGSFTLDTLNLSKKVYEMLNRIAVSGGTYYDWIDANFTSNSYFKAETPIYHGGLSKELIFQEVVSNSASNPGSGEQPLGTLAGRGKLSAKHKGGMVHIKVSEPAYIIGIVSLTPRIDYSQGNKWDMSLKTLDDLHKPALDEIGFQELITEQMAFYETSWNIADTKWETRSAGKQPAWINYMTNYNRTYGNFAIPENEMFMTLNRRYEFDKTTGYIKDLTTYIDPTKFNTIFAQTSLDAQNFWTQIACDVTARRVMSAKIMPNL